MTKKKLTAEKEYEVRGGPCGHQAAIPSSRTLFVTVC